MDQKKVLISLGFLLTIVILGLIFYSYQVNKVYQPTVELDPISKNNLTPTTEESKSDPSKIKEKFENNNSGLHLPEDGQLEEDDLKKIEDQIINSAIGSIKEKQENRLIVNFDYQGKQWESIVNINQETSIRLPASSPNSMGQEINFSDLKSGEQIIVNVEGGIINKNNLTAISIVKI